MPSSPKGPQGGPAATRLSIVRGNADSRALRNSAWALLEKLLQINVASVGGGEGSASNPVGHLTFEDVKRAYEKLEAAGVRVSTRKVHEELGFKGSRTTVVKHFAAIHQTRVAVEPSTSPPLSPLLLRDLASEVDRLVKERTAQLTAELTDLRASLEVVVDENEGFRTAAVDAETRVAALQVSLAEQSGITEALRLQSKSLTEQWEVVTAEAESARQLLAVTREQFRACEERVVRVEAQEAEARRELADARREAVELRGRLETNMRECITLQAQAQAGRQLESRLEESMTKVEGMHAELEEARSRLVGSEAQRIGLTERLKDAQDALSRAEATSQQLLRKVLEAAPALQQSDGS